MLGWIFCLMLCCASVYGRSTYGEALSLPAESIMDPENKYLLRWMKDGENMIFEVEVETTGWVGVGFSSNGDMPGGDIIVLWVKDGVAHLQDSHALSQSLPVADKSQDVELISGSEADGITKIRFYRKLVTCDDEDWKINDDAMRVLWAYGNEDPTDGIFDKHSFERRGSRTLYLLDEVTKYKMEDNVYTVDILNNNVPVPNKPTTYWCTVRPAPVMNGKQHVVAFDVVMPEHTYLLHHIAVYACLDPEFNGEEWADQPDHTGHECHSPEMPPSWGKCFDTIYFWTVGGQMLQLPEHIGYPLGDENSPTYFVLETHYDNYAGHEGVIDNSGVRLHITPTPRKMDMGILPIGMHWSQWFVPPRVNEFNTTGYCSGGCTKEWMPESGIDVFAYVVHGHALTREIHVQHYRDGTELQPIATENNYDFNFQAIHHYRTPRKINQGDEIKVTCKMVSDRDYPVLAGIDSYVEEMCVAYIYYWPKRPISGCASYPPHGKSGDDPVWDVLGVTPSFDDKGVLNLTASLKGLKWNDDGYTAAQNSYYQLPQQSVCIMYDGRTQYESHEKKFNPEPIVEVWREEDVCTAQMNTARGLTVPAITIITSLIAIMLLN